MNARAPQEASANSRAFARTIRDMYVAMLAEGFSPAEAMGILANIVQTTLAIELRKGKS